MSSSRSLPAESSASRDDLRNNEVEENLEERVPSGNRIAYDDELTGLGPTKSTPRSLEKLVADFSFFSGIDMKVPEPNQRPWDCPPGYVCLYESYFRRCYLWLPLPKLLIAYCARRQIAISQLSAPSIRQMIVLLAYCSQLGVELGVKYLENMASINPVVQRQTKLSTGFVYINFKPQYKLVTIGSGDKIADWKLKYFYLKIVPESVGDVQRIIKRRWADSFGRYHLGPPS